ncbi:MAG TPA: DUF4388 domain-containing protein [Thermoanaerobaculia bacterium]|nr:DUF4388 domain-containing protein [Thermoanaerobaculia bacterium]
MKLEGEVLELDLVASLVELGRERFTGAIRFEHDGVIKIVYFKSGDILSASTNDRADSVDEILLRAGKVTREHVKQALARRKESETLGDALLNLGFITRKELTWARRVQVIGVLRSIIGWKGGTYTMVADYLPKREEGTIFSLPQIVIELIVTDQDRARYERELDGGQAVFEKTAEFDAEFPHLGLNEEAEEIALQIDGNRTAADVAAAAAKDEFNVYKLLHALAMLGLLRRRPAAPQSEFAAVPAGEELPPAELPATPASEEWAAPSADFQFDDEPAAEIALDSEPEVATPPPSVNGTKGMPSWEGDETPAPTPLPEPSREAWGFDEAQIETAREATTHPKAPATPRPSSRPVLSRPRPRKRRSAAAASIAIAIVLLGGGFAAWKFWPGAAEKPAASRPARAPQRPAVARAEPGPVAAPAATASETAAPSPVAAVATTTPPAPMPAAPTAPPAPPVPADASRQRFDEMAREFARTVQAKYAVQIALVCQTSSVAGALEAGGRNVWFLPTDYQGKSCYRLLWGSYDTEAAAEAAIASIPAKLRGVKPVVVKVAKE